jgi:hypothetical protein
MLMYCLNGHFDTALHLHHPDHIALTINDGSIKRYQLRHRYQTLKLAKARYRLQQMDEARDELQVTIRRMAQINLTQLAGFSAADEDWKSLVVERLRLKLVQCNGVRRLKLRTEIAQLEASLGVLEDELARLHAEGHHLVLGSATGDGVQAQPDVQTQPDVQAPTVLTVPDRSSAPCRQRSGLRSRGSLVTYRPATAQIGVGLCHHAVACRGDSPQRLNRTSTVIARVICRSGQYFASD